MILATHGIIQSKAAAGGYDADAQAFFTAAGITDTTQKDAVNAMVLSLKSNSLWSKFLAIYPMVGGIESTHKFNLKNPANTDAAYRLTFNGSWSHTSNGAIPNGSNTWADTFIQPSNAALGQNDLAISYYVRNATNNGSLFSILGSGNNGVKFELRSAMGDNGYQCVNSTENPSLDGNATKTGLLILSRIASNEFKRYGRGSLDSTYSANSNAVLTGYSISIGCKYITPSSRSEFTTAGCSFASIGNGLNATEAGNLNTIVQTYQTALSRNIY
jgi:hypothetical protein